MRKLVYFVACSADGFIAREDGAFDFFPMTGDHLPFLAREYPETLSAPVQKALGATGEPRHFSTVVMGRHTYGVGLSMGLTNPYPHLQQFLVSSTLTESPDAAVQLVRRDPVALVRRLKQEPGLGIWLCGGAQLAGALYDEIDELVLKVNPVVIGTGIPLFRGTRDPRPLDLEAHQTFAGGVAIHRYRVRRTP
jgi:dihydrofolate reductase